MSDEWEAMKDEWEAMGVRMICQLASGYEFKVMRRKVKTEREEFIEKCCDRCFGVATTSGYGKLYDAGARFKC
jgi:hypothetical protein